jgi:dTDP-4-amino-4,6-dideoxygalactose transaminase
LDEMTVPFFDYAGIYAMYRDDYSRVVEEVLAQGSFILQEQNRLFEASLGHFLNARHVVGVANGTDAIVIALRAAGVGIGDEVILPSHTYIATAAAVHFVGARPSLVECGPDHLIDPEAAEAAITSATKALLPVQLNGRTADMSRLQTIADRHGLLIIEDAAQAVGSRFRDRSAGTFGITGTYSFYPSKILGGFGDGGAVTTHDDAAAEKIRLLRDHGRDGEGRVVAWGMNSRLDNLQAAALLVRLSNLDVEIERRRQIARQYQDGLGNIGELRLPPSPDSHPDHGCTCKTTE